MAKKKKDLGEDELLKEGPGLCQIAFLLHDVHTVAVRRARNRQKQTRKTVHTIIVTKTLLWLVVCGENVVGRIDEAIQYLRLEQCNILKGTIHELIGWLSLLDRKRIGILLHHSSTSSSYCRSHRLNFRYRRCRMVSSNTHRTSRQNLREQPKNILVVLCFSAGSY